VSFCTYQFLIFFLVVFTLYWAIPVDRIRILILLAASIFFYSCWNHWLALILVVSTLADYLLARGMDATASTRLRKALVAISIVGNLGLLCYFKYADFFLRSLEEAGSVFGFQAALPVLNVLLPVGISFYTFEAINYTVDVYRGKIRAVRDLSHLMLFILFFPHLVAGPIVRARAFLPLVARSKRWSWLRAHAGVQLIVLGVIKKIAIADRMALYVDPVFADPASFATVTLWLAAIAYAIQIYCDFSGYSDMALGLAHLFGYSLAPNFDMPFLAANISELWRRWHISLSTWIRDYLFIPLGGSRCGRWATYRNLLIAFTLCGLWHGARWNFVLWGALNGIALVGHSLFREACDRAPRLSALLRTAAGTAARVALTFLTFCAIFVVFRCPDMRLAATALQRMFVPAAGAGLPLASFGLFLTFALVAVGHALGSRRIGLRILDRLPDSIRGLGFGAALTMALVAAPGISKAFIYFQF
jgi:alginate O-acetyltransferase complex protein AlgI